MAGPMTAYRCDVTSVLAAQMPCRPTNFSLLLLSAVPYFPPAPKASSATAKKCCRIVGPPRRERHLTNGGYNGVPAPLTPVLSGNRRGFYPPVERAVVRTFSIDKMRPVCPVCNPGGDTPYPTGFPQPRCVDDHGKGLNGGDPKNVRQNLIETAADIVHHRWDIDAANAIGVHTTT